MRSVKWKFLISCVMLLIALSPAGSAFARPTDIAGHWAVGQIGDWINKGLASGYPDGTFRPDNTISRAEFVTMANSAFGFNQTGQVNFTDVDSTKWFAGEVSKARAAGYISGYEDGTFRPENQISRQEAASMLAGILKSVTSENTGALSAFKDAGSIPQWSRGSVAAVVARGFMSGYPDQTYRPDKPITRAEALSTLDRALQKARDVTYGKAGTYGPATGVKTIDGNATVSAAGVSLQNLVITGDLLLAQSIGEGDVRLKNVTVKGNTIIKGGGSHSVVLEDCTLPNITVDKDGVRVVASGNTRVNIVRLESGATLVEVTATGNGFENVTVSQVIPAEAKVTLEGNFDQVEVAANKVNIEVAAGKVDKLTVAENATETNVSVAKEATVESATLNSAATISGEGKVKEATVNATGAKIIQTPEKVTVAPSVTTSVGGKETTNTSNSSVTTSNSTGSNTGGGSGGGGSGGGGSSRGSDTTAPAFASTYPKTANVTTTGFDLLVQTNENGNAYFVVLSNNAPPPTAAQVKAGQDSAGTALANSLKGTINLTANTQASSTISGLSASTGYDICVVAEDYVPNVQAGVVKVDVTTTAQDLTPPSYVSAELSNGNKKATLTFSEYIVNNTADAALKDAVTLAADGINYAALTAGDSVSITSGQLVITFENPLVSASNRIRVNADTLRDAAGNVKSDITVTGAIDASYEPDDTFAQATLISTDGTAQRHRIDPATDQDWIKFIAQAGQSYRIRTSNLFPPEINNAVTDMNTWIYLYDTDGTTKLKDNDDSDIDLGESAPLWSLIDWTAPATGTYYVKVIHYDFEDGHDSDEAGSVGQYDISVKAVPRTAAGTLVISPSGATADSVRTITLTYTPGENLVNGSVRFTVPFEIQIALNSSDTVSTAGADPIPLTDGQMGGSEDEGIRTVTVSGINATTSQTVVLTLLNKTVPQPGVYNFSATADADGLAEEKSDSAGTGNESVTFTSNATGTAGTIAVNPATYTVAEDGGSISITVTRTGGSAGAVSVGYTTVDGTAVQPGDYTQTSGALSWADGDTVSKVISVPVIDDAGVESPETFTVVISSPTGGATLGSSTATVTINSDDTSGNTPQGLDIDVSFGSIDVGMSITGSQGPLCYADIAGSLDTSQSKLIISDSSGNQQDIEVTLQQLIDHGFIDQLESEMCIKGNPGLYGAADGSFTSGGLLEDFVPFEHDQVTIILKAADSSWTLTDTVKIPYLDLTASPSGSNLVINIGSNYELDISGSYNNVPLLSATGANFASAMANAGTIGDKAGNPGAIKAFFLPAGDMGGITSLSATLNSADPDTITVSAAKSASGNVSTSIMMFIVDTDNGSLDHLILNLSGTGGSTMVAVTEGAGGPPGGGGGGGSVGTVTLTNPDNQNNNTFAGVTSATGVKLFAFSLDLTDEGVGIGQITIAANNVNGVNIADVSNLKVFIDMDNDGVMDAGEQVTTDGAGGTIGGGPFSLNTTGVGAITGILIGNIQIETFTSGHDIIIQGDVANLSLEDTVTFSVNPADITGVTGLNSGQPITPGGVLVTGVPHIKNS